MIDLIRKTLVAEGGAVFSGELAKKAWAAGFRKESPRLALAHSCGALTDIRTACNKAWEFEVHFAAAVRKLIAADMSLPEARQILGWFGEAFGFPGYVRHYPERVGTLTDVLGKSKFVYEGEVVNGKENGFGKRTHYRGRRVAGTDESIWIDGCMYGYWQGSEVTFGVDIQKVGFLVDDQIVSERRTYDYGAVEYEAFSTL